MYGKKIEEEEPLDLEGKALSKTIKGSEHFLILKKVCDTVNPKILLKKLCRYEIRVNPHELLKSYLVNRKQKVNLKGQIVIKFVTTGAPQGTILGALLFT